MGLKVLLCEDHAAIRELLLATLESNAYEVVQAADGNACLESWRAERPAIVVLDVKMPGKSGPEVLGAARREPELAATPVIMLTGAAEASARETAAEFGVARYLLKPFSPFELITAIEEIGEQLTSDATLAPADVERLAVNEARFRRANERVERLAAYRTEAGVPHDVLLSFVCECADSSCVRELRMTIVEYEDVRADPAQFAVAPGHELSAIDRVVARNDRFSTVEKLPGRAAGLAVESDPRASRR